MKLVVLRESLFHKKDDTQNCPWPGTRIENIREYEGLDNTYCDWVMYVNEFADLEQFLCEGHEIGILPTLEGYTLITIMDGADEIVQDKVVSV